MARLLLWPQMSEFLSENGILHQPDPKEGIGTLTLVVAEIFCGYIVCGAYGQGVMEIEKPKLHHSSDINSFFILIPTYSL